MAERRFPDEGVESFDVSKDEIELHDVGDDSEVTLLVPHSDASAMTAMVCSIFVTSVIILTFGVYQKVNLEIEYITVDEPSTVRVSYFTRVLITTLPISVNVEDFFRGTRLIIFSIDCIVSNSPQFLGLSQSSQFQAQVISMCELQTLALIFPLKVWKEFKFDPH